MKNPSENIAHLRQEYLHNPFDISDAHSDPIIQFDRWFAEARKAGLLEPNAMTLATASENGSPSARIVLLKGVDERGFVFYTNYNSKKGMELAANPQAALVFNWLELARQIRIEGRVVLTSEEESTTYFQSRPKASQIGAWASAQSTVISDRRILEEEVGKISSRFAEAEALPRPEHWGGYRVQPHYIEFWQGRPSRLHDRICYTLQENGIWQVSRLAP